MFIYAVFIVCVFPMALNGIRHRNDNVFTAPDVIRFDGYPLEIHHVKTEDGYILEMHRIPYGRNDSYPSFQRPVALFAHCYFCSSGSFVALDPENSLAYILANNGYDVWLVNGRGTAYSKKHVHLSSSSKMFWNFSWHELGYYDLPACIDYALDLTGERQLDFIGFSMGTTQFMVLMSERPEYNQKIRHMIALAPSAFLKKSRGSFPTKFPVGKGLKRYGDETGNLEFPEPGMHMNRLFSDVCQLNLKKKRKMCSFVLKLAGGSSTNNNTDQDSLPFFLKFFPESASIGTILHYEQIIKTGDFQKFNYGKRLNMLKYGTPKPPSYNLSRVTAPISIFWAENDELTPESGTLRLISTLPNIVFCYRVPYKDFAHIDFIWGSNVVSLVYDVVLRRLKETTSLRQL